jgi:hypothetical protein
VDVALPLLKLAQLQMYNDDIKVYCIYFMTLPITFGFGFLNNTGFETKTIQT